VAFWWLKLMSASRSLVGCFARWSVSLGDRLRYYGTSKDRHFDRSPNEGSWQQAPRDIQQLPACDPIW